MAINSYYIGGYKWLLVVFLLVVINGYYIGGYFIDDYCINGY